MTAPDVRVCPSCQSSYTPTGAGQKFCRKLCKRFNYQLRRYGRETAEMWRAHKVAQMRTPVVVRQVTPTREQIARAIALTDDIDGCFERIDEWEALEEWEREAQPQEAPLAEYEDAGFWLRRADAVLELMQNHTKGD